MAGISSELFWLQIEDVTDGQQWWIYVT